MTDQVEWYVAMDELGHAPVLDQNGDLDDFVLAKDHNGPGCSTCGWRACWHCKA